MKFGTVALLVKTSGHTQALSANLRVPRDRAHHDAAPSPLFSSCKTRFSCALSRSRDFCLCTEERVCCKFESTRGELATLVYLVQTETALCRRVNLIQSSRQQPGSSGKHAHAYGRRDADGLRLTTHPCCNTCFITTMTLGTSNNIRKHKACKKAKLEEHAALFFS